MKKHLLTIILLALMCWSNSMNAQAPNWAWAKKAGGTSNDGGYCLVTDDSGNVYITGMYSGTVDFDPGAGVANLTGGGIFVSKMNSAGNLVWVKKTGVGQSFSIALDASGNIYTTGNFTGTVDFDPGAGTYDLTTQTAVGVEDVFISKLDNAGNFVWAKNMGGGGANYGLSIVIDASGNVYTTGNFAGTIDMDPGTGVYNLTSIGSMFVSKLDNSGNFVWAKQATAGTTCNAIALDASGNVFTTGFYGGTVDFDPGSGTHNLTATSTYDAFILKLDNSGNFMWVDDLGSSLYGVKAFGIAVDASGYVYTVGNFEGTVDFDPGPGTYNITTGTMYLLKLDNAGNFAWAGATGGMCSDFGKSVTVDPFGNILITGYYSGTVDFDPSPSTYNLTPTTGTNIFISKFDSAGNFVWAEGSAGPIGNTGDGKVYGIDTDPAGNVYITGRYTTIAHFSTSTLSVSGADDIFIAKLGNAQVGISEIANQQNDVKIFPNPFTSLTTITFSEGQKNTTVKIMNILGECIQQLTTNNQQLTLDMSGLANGVYFLSVSSEQGIVNRKIVKK